MKGLRLAIAILISCAPPALANPVKASDPATVATALQNAGFRAKMDKSDDGDPKIISASEGNNITIYFMGCAKNKDCSYIEIIVLWDCTPNMVDKCKAVSEKWNSEEHFASTMITGKDIALYHYLDLDLGGMSEELFVDNFKTISSAAVGLEKQFGEK